MNAEPNGLKNEPLALIKSPVGSDNVDRQMDQSSTFDQEAQAQMDALLDEALNETFPASDPISISPRKNRH